MPRDIKLTTKRIPGIESSPSQPGNPEEFIGEETNDLQLNTVNDIDTIEGTEKLKQDINKLFLTERGTNVFFELYGTELQSLVGEKVNPDVIRAKIKDEIISGLQVLQFINRENPNDDEKPEVLELLDIQQIDTNSFEVQISVITASNKRVSTGITVSI